MYNWSDIENIQGTDFPDLYARDETSLGAKDGTRLRQKFMSDVMGAFQALVDGIGETPSLTREVVGDSQILKAILGHAGAPGEAAWWFGPSAAGIPSWVRLLPLEGQTIVHADYPLLTECVYCGDTINSVVSSFYKCTDTAGATRSTSGTYLKLPDARGRFLRAIDYTGAIDPIASRYPGSTESAGIAQHSHSKLYVSTTEYKLVSTALASGALGVLGVGVSGASLATGETGTGIGSGTTNETRPANLAARLCIRY